MWEGHHDAPEFPVDARERVELELVLRRAEGERVVGGEERGEVREDVLEELGGAEHGVAGREGGGLLGHCCGAERLVVVLVVLLMWVLVLVLLLLVLVLVLLLMLVLILMLVLMLMLALLVLMLVLMLMLILLLMLMLMLVLMVVVVAAERWRQWWW